jgi:uncharacterized protein (DUF1778 family)
MSAIPSRPKKPDLRQHFGLNAEQWIAFMVALDVPPRHHARLEHLLIEPSIFEANTPIHHPG